MNLKSVLIYASILLTGFACGIMTGFPKNKGENQVSRTTAMDSTEESFNNVRMRETAEPDSLCTPSFNELKSLIDTTELDTISLDSARLKIRMYARFQRMLANSIRVETDSGDSVNKLIRPYFPRAFSINRNILEGILKYKHQDYEECADGARVYLGIDSSSVHLYMVPTYKNQDMIPTHEGNQVVYNFITPCPQLCDTSGSVLNAASLSHQTCGWRLRALYHFPNLLQNPGRSCPPPIN